MINIKFKSIGGSFSFVEDWTVAHAIKHFSGNGFKLTSFIDSDDGLIATLSSSITVIEVREIKSEDLVLLEQRSI